MRCHHALYEWRPLRDLVEETDNELMREPKVRWEFARYGAEAAWNLAIACDDEGVAALHWGAMERYVGSMREGSLDECKFSAVLSVRQRQLGVAQRQIDRARMVCDAELAGLVGESYRRAYRMMVALQQLAELEEVVMHCRSPAALTLDHLTALWRSRISQCARSVQVWRMLFSVQVTRDARAQMRPTPVCCPS